MNKNRVAQLRDQLSGLSPDDDMYQTLVDEIMMLQGKGVYSKNTKGMRNGGLARGKRNIARGCGAVMEKRRKKTLYT